jgi:signal peptidase I
MNKDDVRRKKDWTIVKVAGFSILIFVFLRIFVFSFFKVPTSSMEPTIFPDDYIVVNKLILGPRLFDFWDFKDKNKISYKRLRGIRVVNRNDVLVFNLPYKADREKLIFDFDVFLVKRCVAIPGDVFYIENGIYRIKNNHDTLGCYSYQKEFAQRNAKSIRTDHFKCFPYDTIHGWNVMNFGPIFIPGKGDRLSINSHNITLYKGLIQYETKIEISIKGDRIYIGDRILKDYTFTKDYYFMAGDYSAHSIDSRFWGLLPEDHIVGKAVLRWKSEDKDSDKFRWGRFLKLIK